MITVPTAAGATTEYENFYETTLQAPLGVADADIFVTTLPSSAVGFLVIDPLGTTPEVIFYNFKGANFVRVPSVVDGEGRGCGSTTPRPYDQGTKIGMYSIAEFFEGIVTGRFMRDGFLQSRHFSAGIDPNSWIGTGETWNYVGNNGNKMYQYVTAGDKTAKYSNGMKLRLPRVVTAPTQCADLESSSSQYAAKAAPAGITFNDDFTIETWVRLESYGTNMTIAGRSDATPANGFYCEINGSGQVNIIARNAGAGNFSQSLSYQSIPLGTWVHIAACLDMSTFTSAGSPIYINGVSVPVAVTRSGSNPATLVQAGDLAIGRPGLFAGNYFDGELADVRVWSTIRSQVQVRDNMHKQLIGNEAGLVSYFKLDGNFNDSTANLNHLTGAGGAVATTVDNPFKAIEYAVITDRSFSAGNTTMTIFTGKSHNAPYENLSGIAYSGARTPYGFPAERGKWRVEYLNNAQASTAIGASGFATPTGMRFTIPPGSWNIGYNVAAQFNPSAPGSVSMKVTLNTASGNTEDKKFTKYANMAASTASIGASFNAELPIELIADTDHYINVYGSAAGTVYLMGDNSMNIVYADCPYI